MEHQIELLTPEVSNQYLKSFSPDAVESVFRDTLSMACLTLAMNLSDSRTAEGWFDRFLSVAIQHYQRRVK